MSVLARLNQKLDIRLGTLALAFICLAPFAGAEPQQAGKIARIGYLLLPPLTEEPSSERQAFLDRLHELGYVEGRNLIIEYQSAGWTGELLPDLAAELVEDKVDVIFVLGPQAAKAAVEATKTIPIVAVFMGDPIELGLGSAFARPGGNVTGFTTQYTESSGKRLELLREAVPHVSHVYVIWNPGNPAAVAAWKATETAARTLGVKLESLEVRGAEDFLAALPKTLLHGPAAVLMIEDTLTESYRGILAEFAMKNRLPAIMARRPFVELGGLMSYGPKMSDLFRRAAGHVDKILKGSKPADLPFENPIVFELVINMRSAKAFGLTIPPSLLLRADHVIE